MTISGQVQMKKYQWYWTSIHNNAKNSTEEKFATKNYVTKAESECCNTVHFTRVMCTIYGLTNVLPLTLLSSIQLCRKASTLNVHYQVLLHGFQKT